MERSKYSQHVLAVALCKKLSQADSYYSWSLQAGEARLLAQAKVIYKDFFHQKGGRVPRLALIAEDMRIGLLLAGLSEEEQHDKSAENILAAYLEFDEKDVLPVFQAAAALLYAYDDSLYPECFQRFWDYSRQLPAGTREQTLARPPSIELPECREQAADAHTFLSTETALPSIRHNRRKCAYYLQRLSESDEPPCSLTLISAGRVERGTLQQFADKHSLGTLIVLTLSATVQDELDLRSTAERYIPETIRERVMTSVKRFFSKH